MLPTELVSKIKTITGFSPSKYQEEILDFIINEKGSASINAVAGAGKSSSLLQIAITLEYMGYQPSDLRAVVFGKANSVDLAAKFSVLGEQWKICTATLHSLGYNLSKKQYPNAKWKVSGYKYSNIARELGYVSEWGSDVKGSLTLDDACNEWDFVKLLDIIRLNNCEVTSETVRDIVLHHTLDVKEYSIVASAINEILESGKLLAKLQKQVDFVDMIWMPMQLGIPNTSDYKFLLVDEDQDLSNAQRDLLSLLQGPNTRLIFVGDKKQAIYGFIGAANNSTELNQEQFKTKSLSLSLCYRCPKSHIALVKAIFPSIKIEAPDHAVEGNIKKIFEDEIFDRVDRGDLILCRTTAPLISLCIQLIAEGKAAKVKGTDIGKMILKELKIISKIENFNFQQLAYFCKLYVQEKYKQYESRENCDLLMSNLQNKIDCILAIVDMKPDLKDLSSFGKYTKSLFTDSTTSILLSTVHKAKGLEADRVFLYKPDKMPMVWEDQQDWEFQQELNILYVALTRAKKDLFIIGDNYFFKKVVKSFLEKKDREAVSLETEFEQAAQQVREKEEVVPVIEKEEIVTPTYTNFEGLSVPNKPEKTPKWFLKKNKQLLQDYSFATLYDYQQWRNENKDVIGSESHIYSFNLSPDNKVWLVNKKGRIPKRNRTKG